jgi:large subunit ribosomal protein L17
MHRHGYNGRKFGRQAGPRRALIKGLASNLATYETIETTLPKAKELVPYFEKLITKAKKGDLHNRRLIIAKMANIESAHKLVDEIAPKLKSRNSGYLKIVKTRSRRGDNTVLAKVSFVDDLKISKNVPESTKKATSKAIKSTETRVRNPLAKKESSKKEAK